MSKVLVTGGYGFIGGNFIRFLHEKSCGWFDIVCVDKDGYASNPDYIEGCCEVDYVLDLADAFAVNSMFEKEGGFDYIFHFAAESHVDNSIADPSVFIQSNVVGTQNLLECFRKSKKGTFIHVSTDEVYGHLGPEDEPFTEDSPISPRSPYAASKAASDLIALAYYNTYNLDIRITRCCNNYGPNQHHEKFIPTIIKSLKDGKKIPVYGDGRNVREWIHVMDHVEGIWNVATKGNPGEIYNIGTMYDIANIHLVDVLCAIFRKDILDEVEFVKDRPGHDFRYCMDSTKAAVNVGYKPTRTDFVAELKKYVKYLETNER